MTILETQNGKFELDPNRKCYIPSWLKFEADSESGTLASPLCHIRVELRKPSDSRLWQVSCKKKSWSKYNVLYIILTRILRGFWISNQKFQIQPIASAITGLVLSASATSQKIWPSLIRVIYISSWPEFWGDSEYLIRNFKFSLWHLL